MAFSMLSLMLFLALSAQIHSHPITFLRHLSPTSRSDSSWPFNLAFGWGESTVSVVDRTPSLTFSARAAAFGAELEDPLLGYVIPLSSFTTPCASANASNILSDGDNTACPTLCIDGSHQPERTETWIALVQRGQCQFVDKVREAQRLGANAVVVGGDNPETSGNPDTLVNMYSPEDASDVSIAATFIKYSDYMELSALIEVSNTSHSGLKTLSLLLTTDYSAWEWPVLTFAIILLLPSSLTLITLFIHRVRTARAARRDRAPEDIVKSLPSRVWTGTRVEKQDGVANDSSSGSGNAESNDDIPQPSNGGDASTSQAQPWHVLQSECAICLSDFVKGDTVRILPCHHIFHLDEVDAWLIHRKKLCPICKADVTQPLQKLDSCEPSASADAAEETTTPPADDPQPTAPSSERTPLLSRTSS